MEGDLDVRVSLEHSNMTNAPLRSCNRQSLMDKVVLIVSSENRSKIVESVSPCDFVGKASRVRMVFVGVDLDVEGVRDDFSVLGQALAHQTR